MPAGMAAGVAAVRRPVAVVMACRAVVWLGPLMSEVAPLLAGTVTAVVFGQAGAGLLSGPSPWGGERLLDVVVERHDLVQANELDDAGGW